MKYGRFAMPKKKMFPTDFKANLVTAMSGRVSLLMQTLSLFPVGWLESVTPVSPSSSLIELVGSQTAYS